MRLFCIKVIQKIQKFLARLYVLIGEITIIYNIYYSKIQQFLAHWYKWYKRYKNFYNPFGDGGKIRGINFPPHERKVYKNFCFLYHLCKIANNQSVTSDTKKSLFVSFAKTTCPACKKMASAGAHDGRAGRWEKGREGKRAKGAKREKCGKMWWNRSSKLSLKKKFSARCRNTELPFKKNVIFAGDGQQERSRGAQATAKDISQQASAGDCKSASAQRSRWAQQGRSKNGRKTAF